MTVYLVVHEDWETYDIVGAYDNKEAAYAHIDDTQFLNETNASCGGIIIQELRIDSEKQINPYGRLTTIFKRKLMGNYDR